MKLIACDGCGALALGITETWITLTTDMGRPRHACSRECAARAVAELRDYRFDGEHFAQLRRRITDRLS